MNKTQLEMLGKWAFGESWKAQLGRELNIDRRRITAWVSGRDQIPLWLIDEMQTILDKRAAEITVAKDFILRIKENK